MTAGAVSGVVGAASQHTATPTGSITPRTFTINGQTYEIRGWYTRGTTLEINMETEAQEAAFKAAGLTIDLGQGNTINSADLVDGAALTATVTPYTSGTSYTITITPS